MSKDVVHILDDTLRDGSYAIDFQFTAQDTANIVSSLEAAGIEWIEIGHGMGMGATRTGRGVAAATDEAYLNAAAETLTSATFGPFFISGIGTKEDIDCAVDCNADFIRIGTDALPDAVEKSLPFIEYAKNKGLTVLTCQMKTYLVPPHTFADNVDLHAKAGADVVYIMDSAGGMLPNEVRDYVEAGTEASSTPVGFHGHDNLSLAIDNSLEALKAGAQFVDASLQGLGRSAGNAVLETLVAERQGEGYNTNIDLEKLIEASNTWISPRLSSVVKDPLSFLSGRAKLHSAVLPLVIDVASQVHTTPEALLTKISEIGTLDHSQANLESIAKSIQDESS